MSNIGMKINIGQNEIRIIASYEDILKMKLGYGKLITPEQYLSMLFNNMGYSLRPDNCDEIKALIPINQISILKYFQFPEMKYCQDLVFAQNKTSLKQFINVVKNWIVGEMERGHILDMCNSFKFPSTHELEFNIKNNINMERNGKTKSRIDYWNTSDIFIRRLYNISPKIDKEYFNKCIIDFWNISDKIQLYQPWICFISCLINPDLFFNMIRNAEKEAFNFEYDKLQNDYKYSILITDEQLLKPFEIFLNLQVLYLLKIFKEKGYEGFILPHIQDKTDIISAQSPIDTENYTTIGSDIQLDQNTINNINNQIFRTVLDGDHKSYILQYVDANSLNILNELGENNIVRRNSYKKLYYTIMQIKQYNPELLNRKEKFLFSSPFYVNQEIFALYHKQRNTFFIAFPDLVLREMSPKKAIEFYKKYLGMDIKLNSKEMMDSYDSAAVPFIDLELLSDGKIVKEDIVPVQNYIENTVNEESTNNNTIEEQNDIPIFVEQNIQPEYIEYDINDIVDDSTIIH